MKFLSKHIIAGATAIATLAFATASSADTMIILVDYYGNCAERIDKFTDKIAKAKRPNFRPYTLSQATEACREGRVRQANMIVAELEDEWDFRNKVIGKKRPE